MPGGLLDLLPHVIVAVEVEGVGDEVQGVLVVLHLRVEARQVEAVRQVLLVDLAKVLVAAGGYELEERQRRGKKRNEERRDPGRRLPSLSSSSSSRCRFLN